MITMEKYKINSSIRDVIHILDSAPIQPDMIDERNVAQLTNRAPIAHLAIERGLKALTTQAGGVIDRTHSLHKLYLELLKCDVDSGEYLTKAFKDAVTFYGYNINAKGFGQFRSLEDYLSKVGGEKAFDELRYWAIGEFDKSNSPISFISLPIHRELLCALERLCISGFRETVSARVEHEVHEAVTRRTRLAYGEGDTQRENSINWYLNWLRKHGTRSSALEEAVQRKFIVKEDDEVVSQILRDAYDDLKKSEDPAVRYYVGTLNYLPRRSQQRNPNAIPNIKWFDADQTSCRVSTPAGSCLGYIYKQADAAWAVSPQVNGPVGVSVVAWAYADAKHYLVNRLTRQINVTVCGETKPLRIVSEKDFFPLNVGSAGFQDVADWDSNGSVHGLEFWDAEHGLRSGDEVRAELQTEESPGVMSVLEGTVVKVVEENVSIAGSNYFGRGQIAE